MRARSRKLEISSAGRLGVPLVAQMVKDLPAIWEAQVWLLGQEDLLEKEMAIHSCILAWRILWTEEPSGLQSMGSQRIGHDCMTSTRLNGANTFFVATITREI